MIPEAIIGELSVLNCGEGDIKVSLDRDRPEEVAKAKKIISDMMKRGYFIFIDEGDGKLKRVRRFDPTKAEYIIQEGDAANVDQKETKATGPKSKAAGKSKAGQERRVPIRKARATGVAPTAGG